MNQRLMASEIEACTPLRVRNFRRIMTGWEYAVLEVNGEYVFRFPRFRDSWKRLSKEVSLTTSLSGRLPVQVPTYEYTWPGDRSHPQRFAGYRKIMGVPCTDYNYRRSWLESLGEDLGRFLTELHALRLPQKVLSGLKKHTPRTWAKNSRKFYGEIRRYAYPLLTDDVRARAKSVWTGLLSTFEAAKFNPSFIHSDLTGGNIICDPMTGRLNGVIDWPDAQVADPALDFVGIFQVNRRLGESVLGRYGLAKSGFMERIELYLKTIPYGEITWGVKQKSNHHVKIGLRHLRASHLQDYDYSCIGLQEC